MMDGYEEKVVPQPDLGYINQHRQETQKNKKTRVCKLKLEDKNILFFVKFTLVLIAKLKFDVTGNLFFLLTN